MRVLTLLLCLISIGGEAKYSKQLVVEGLGIPWAIVDTGNELLITERSGTLKRFIKKEKSVKVIVGTPNVYSRGQGGLLDVKLDPNFRENKFIYLSYAKKMGDVKTTAVGRGKYINGELKDFKDIFIAKGNASKRIHFGSRISFDHKGFIFISVGDRGVRANAQNLTNHFGKIIRLNKDGSIPADNPFYNKKESLPEIWSFGHRNPQGLFFDGQTNQLFEMEHGPRGGDEINLIHKGANYGWPIISYGKEYMLPVSVGEGTHKKGMAQPLKYYVPSIAPSDLIYYKGEKYPELKGSLISGALKLTHLNSFNPTDQKEIRLFDSEHKRVRSVTLDTEGSILFGTDDGVIFKLIFSK